MSDKRWGFAFKKKILSDNLIKKYALKLMGNNICNLSKVT